MSRGAGALVQTEVERVDLGEHAGRQLRVLVEHRTLRLALGRWWSGSLVLGRRTPVRVEVVSVAGAAREAQYDVHIPRPADPWPRYLRRVLVLAGGCWLVVRLVRRSQRDEGT